VADVAQVTQERELVTRYAGRCRVCGQAVQPGQKVLYGGPAGVRHPECRPAPVSAAPRAPRTPEERRAAADAARAAAEEEAARVDVAALRALAADLDAAVEGWRPSEEAPDVSMRRLLDAAGLTPAVVRERVLAAGVPEDALVLLRGAELRTAQGTVDAPRAAALWRVMAPALGRWARRAEWQIVAARPAGWRSA
jgi:hypothetical protein